MNFILGKAGTIEISAVPRKPSSGLFFIRSAYEKQIPPTPDQVNALRATIRATNPERQRGIEGEIESDCATPGKSRKKAAASTIA
jgi:hypothetical protein